MTRLASLLLCLPSCACTRCTKHQVFELPPAYHGWVHVAVDMPGCPPLDVRDGVTHFVIKPDGTACTSEAPQLNCGWFKERYFYRDEHHTELQWTNWGGGGMIWGGHSIGIRDTAQRKRYLCPFGFFVGAESEFKASRDNGDDECSPREFDARRTPGVIGPCVD